MNTASVLTKRQLHGHWTIQDYFANANSSMIALKFMMRFDSCERTEGNQLKVQHSECKEIHTHSLTQAWWKEATLNRNYLANSNRDAAAAAADTDREINTTDTEREIKELYTLTTGFSEQVALKWWTLQFDNLAHTHLSNNEPYRVQNHFDKMKNEVTHIECLQNVVRFGWVSVHLFIVCAFFFFCSIVVVVVVVVVSGGVVRTLYLLDLSRVYF